MKVDLSNPNFKPAGVRTNVKKSEAAPSFSGMSALEKDIMNSLYHKKAIGRMKKLEWLKGEIGGILITALGTGAVAPIFIAFNPFVHAKKGATEEEKQEVKNTKIYTGMRQPISAGLAILFQASIQKYIDKGLDKIFNIPENAVFWRDNLDQSYMNTETFVKDKVRRQLKEEGIKKPSLFASWFGAKEIIDGEKVSLREKYNMMFNDRVDAIRDKQLEDIAKAFERDNKIYVSGRTGNDGVIRLGNRTLNNESVAELVNKQIEEYQSDARKLKKTEQQIDFYKDRANVLIKNEEKLRTMFSAIPLEEIKNTYDSQKLKELYAQTTEIVKDLYSKEEDPAIKKILKEILDRPEDLRASRIDRTFQRIESIRSMCASRGGFTPENYEDALIERNNVLDKKIIKLESSKIKDTTTADENIIRDAIEKIKTHCCFKDGDGVTQSVLKDTDTFSADPAKLKSKIYKDITKGYKELVKNNYKSINQVAKVLIGVFITLPITCTALNWIYPRFMDMFFPGLNKKKTDTQAKEIGGDK